MVPMPAHQSPVATPAERGSLRGLASATFFGLLLIGLLAGCGSGGSGGDGSGSPPGGSGNIVSGTAATGDPIAFGTVTLKDSLGTTRSIVTDENGNYSLDASGYNHPFILRAAPKAAGSVPLYSFADKPGITNITPLTDLVLYEALGRSDVGTVFDSGDLSKLTISAVSGAESMVRSNIVPQLTANGLSPETDLFRTPFTANGTGLDAVIQNILPIPLPGGVLRITGLGGLCEPYGNVAGITFAIDGINGPIRSAPAFFDVPQLVGSITGGYLQKALAKCVAGRIENVEWSGYPSSAETDKAVISLKNKLTLYQDQIRRGEAVGPINIVAHSWGTVIAYLALYDLAIEKSPVHVQHLITMGSPLEYLHERCTLPGLFSICAAQSSLPDRLNHLRGAPIKLPSIKLPSNVDKSNVDKWTNYYLTPGDVISSAIIDVGNKIENEPVEDCPAPLLPSTTPIVNTCRSHSVYYDTGLTPVMTPIGIQSVAPPSTAPTLFKIQDLLGWSQASSSPVPPVVLPSPGAFTVTAGAPYCDTRVSVGPAVKLTWSASTNASFYRVFRDGRATGVQLGSSQLDFVNELGLVAGQSYSYTIKATNASGEKWTNTSQVTIPADVCSLNFISPSLGTISTSTAGYQPTLTVSGNVTQVSFSWSGATSGSATWVKNDANWLSKVMSNPDGTLTLRPVVTQAGDAPGITNWTVTIRDSTGATQIQNFAVNYQSTVPGGGGGTSIVYQPGNDIGVQDIWTTSRFSYTGAGEGPGGGLNDERLRVGGNGDWYYSLIQFDLSQLPPVGSKVELQLYMPQVTGAGTTELYVDRITAFWDWRTQGTGQDRLRLWWADLPTAIPWIPSSLPAPTAGQWYVIDITTLYNAWQSGTYPNYGVQLRTVTSSNKWADFSSSNSADALHRPRLVITPTTVPGGGGTTPAPAITSPGTGTPPGPTVANLTPTFTWTAVTGASHYGLYVSREPYGEANIVYQTTALTGTAHTIPSGPLLNGVKYRWDMTSFNGSGGESASSSDLHFQTPPGAVLTPFISSVTSGLRATTSVQTVSVFGSNFVTGASVTLTAPDGTPFNNCCLAGAPVVVSLSEIQIKPNFLGDAGIWKVQVTNPGSSGSNLVSFTVAADVLPPTPSITAFTALPTRVAVGGTVTVSWNATDVDSCTISRNGAPWRPALPANASKVVSGSDSDTITSETRYTITCTNNAGASVTATRLVKVAPTLENF
jgi:hypothetical protein